MLIVYLPFLHKAFSTYALPFNDWLIVGGLALPSLPVPSQSPQQDLIRPQQ